MFLYCADFQKLEREARICRKLQHPNIGKSILFLSTFYANCDRFNRNILKMVRNCLTLSHLHANFTAHFGEMNDFHMTRLCSMYVAGIR